MKKCYASKKNTIIRYSKLILGICFGLFLMAVALILWDDTDREMMALCGLSFFLGVLSVVYYPCFDILFFREYSLSDEGITIQYAGRKQVLQPWNKVSQICRCEIHRASNGGIWDDVIWVTFGHIKNGPPDDKRRWNNPEYGLLHFRSVLTLEYTPERFAEFQRYAPCEILDYRSVR